MSTRNPDRYITTLFCLLATFAACALILSSPRKVHGPIVESLATNPNINQTIATLLVKKKGETHADSALGLLLDAKTGVVMAEVCQAPDSTAGLQTHCSERPYEPGSVMKPLLLASALNENAITLDTTFIDNGVVTINGRQIRNVHTYEKDHFTARDFINESMNTGAVKLLEKLSPHNKIDTFSRQKWYKYLTQRYMFGQPTTNSPNQSNGAVIPPNAPIDNLDFRYASSAIGISVTTTPLQLCAAYAAIINDGRYIQPTFDQHISPGRITPDIIRTEVSQNIRSVLTDAYHHNKLGSDYPGYQIGGKSGTAPIAENDVYTTKEMGTYIGYIHNQSNDKTYILLTRFENPQTNKIASREAAEVWSTIVKQLVNDRSI